MPFSSSQCRRPRWPAALAAVLILAALLALAGAGGGALAQEMRYLRIATGTTSGTYFPIGSLIANGLSNPPGPRPCEDGGSCGLPGVIAVAQASAGSVENIELLRAGAVEAALVQADIAYQAFHGNGLYQGAPPLAELRAIASLYTEALHVVVPATSELRRIEHLRGRVLWIGEKGAGFFADAQAILAAHGLGEGDYQLRLIKIGAALDQFVAGRIDALFIIGGPPFGAVREVAGRSPIRLLPVEGATADQLLRALPFFSAIDLGAGTYPGLPAVRTLGVAALLVVRAELDHQLAGGIARLLWQLHLSQQRQRLASPVTVLTPGSAGLPLPLHPGAASFFDGAKEAALALEPRSGSAGGPTPGPGALPSPVLQLGLPPSPPLQPLSGVDLGP